MNLAAQIRWSVGYRGWWATLGCAVAAVGRRLGRKEAVAAVHGFDREHGTDTGGLILGRKLGGGAARAVHATGYAAVPPSRMRYMLALFRERAGVGVEECAFLDAGCGKGRALLLAAEEPFREAVGVELDAGLAAIAERNLAAWASAGRARCAARVVQGDVMGIELPAAPSLLFLYNPFDAAMVSLFVDRAAEAAERTPEPVFLLYYKESAGTPTRSDARLELLWRGVAPLAEEDREGEPVASEDDEASLYRVRGRREAAGA